MKSHMFRAGAALTFSSAAFAQGPAFQTPGMPTMGGSLGQATRFSNEFNPAFGVAIDLVGDYLDEDGGIDGWATTLRAGEIVANAWVDPKAWAYIVLTSEGEAPDLEEASVHYVGLDSNTTIRAGRFFVDFGKQMQAHVHDLRTLERPAVLRTLLGTEVKGDGFQVDHWWATGDATAVRASFGAFRSLFPEEEDAVVARETPERSSLGDLNFTARVTGFTDVGDSGVFQLGASARMIPDYEAVDTGGGGSATGLDDTVFGVDATYGWSDDTGLRKATFGGEYLVATGDRVDSTLAPYGDTTSGYYVFGDYAWSRSDSAGVQFSAVEVPEAGSPDLSELELYYTHWFSEYHRLRFVAAQIDAEVDPDATRFAVQYTVFLGSHQHGLNW
ncbi:MAG: hypothetical protein HZA52_14890 [Planctomycetes bacterium]|nr:hypothetical protein [Planctomycetota bacterium]